jgi:hypothetical protein
MPEAEFHGLGRDLARLMAIEAHANPAPAEPRAGRA